MVNQSIAWASDSKQLFALSHDRYVHHVDVSVKTALSKLQIHSSSQEAGSIALASDSDGTFIATSGFDCITSGTLILA